MSPATSKRNMYVCLSVCPLDINCDNLSVVDLGLIFLLWLYFVLVLLIILYLITIKNGGHLRFMREILVKLFKIYN